MNGKKMLAAIFLLCFFVSACSKDSFDYRSAYEEGRFDDILANAETVLSEELDEDALYYRALAYYVEGDMDESYAAARLFSLVYDDSDYAAQCHRIILHSADRSDDDVAIESGRYLSAESQLSKQDKIMMFQRLSRSGATEEADELYAELKNLLNPFEEAIMDIIAETDSTRILYSLESLYSVSGLSGDFIRAMKLAIPLFINRGESSLLLPLVEKGNLGDTSYMLLIGDLMYSMNNRLMAKFYWSQCMQDFPIQANLRLVELGEQAISTSLQP